jgi:hypothetical protein
MGWKKLKECFEIGHIVQVTKEGICIGSGYVSDLVTVDPSTGAVAEHSTFSGFLKRECPALLAASAEEVLQAINAEDKFTAAITVYTYEGSKIIEKLCEEPGWPNVTHDGELMYENRFSTDKETVVQWAKRNAALGVKFAKEAVADAEKALSERQAYLAQCEAENAEINAAYPDVVAAD